MKKILSYVMSLLLFLGISVGANAAEIKDIPADYWANTEINAVVDWGIMPLEEDGNFLPDKVVKRIDFAKWVLKALDNDTFQITVNNHYSDVTDKTDGYETILRNDQLGLIYGYTDGTFKPERVITKAETNSIMSHITKSTDTDKGILDQFKDKKDIPAWAVKTYEKTVKYGLYVNHPNLDELLPKKDLNRAEAAVLLYKLRNALNLVKKAYKPETPPVIEHLNVTPKAPNNTVQITSNRMIVDEGNVIQVAFESRFNSKNFNVGDEVHFFLKEDLKTQEGTLVLPAKTKFLAEIATLEDPRWLNKNAKMTLKFKKITTNDGKDIELQGTAFENDGVLVSNYWEKPLFWTLGGALVGTGIGLGVGCGCDNAGVGLAVGLPSGAAAGAGIGLLTPGVNFGASEGDQIYLLLSAPFSIYTCTGESEE